MFWKPFSNLVSILGFTHVQNNLTKPSTAQPILIDTDIFSDVDDLGAIAIANVLHNCGLADIKGIAINTHSRYGALATNAVNTYYSNPTLPIAALRPLTNATFLDTHAHTLSEFATKIAYHWPRNLHDVNTTPAPLTLYRRVLAAADNASLHLISLGFLTNLAVLLRSPPDEISPLTGAELISAKVSELVVMGGRYPSGRDYNFRSDLESAIHVLHHWPRDVAITYSGGELGRTIFSGQTLPTDAPPGSPVLAAYQWYVGRCGSMRQSWDPITLVYGVLGLDGFAQVGVEAPFSFANEFGYNSIVRESATNVWVNDSSVRNQHWLRLADGVANTSVSALLNRFLTQDPGVRMCFGYGDEI